MNLSTKQKWIYRRREQTCGCQGGGKVEGEKDWEFGISRCKLLYIGWISNKVPLYSIGNYIQFPGINHNGKEYLKKKVHMCETVTAIQQRLVQHCKSTILDLFLKKEKHNKSSLRTFLMVRFR